MSGNMGEKGEAPSLRIISLMDQHGTTFTAVCEAAWSAIDKEGRTIVLTLHEAVCTKCGESMRVGHQCQANQPQEARLSFEFWWETFKGGYGETGIREEDIARCAWTQAKAVYSSARQPREKAQPESQQKRDQLIESCIERAFQRGQQAMAEKAAQHLEKLLLFNAAQDIRSLASAEPLQGEAEKEGRG